MNKLTIDDLLNLVKSYNPSEVEIIKKPIIMLTIFIRDKKDKVENLNYSSSQCYLYSRRNAR